MKRASPRALLALASCVLATAIALSAPVASQAAEPDQLWQKCPGGSAAGQCLNPRGIAADPETGHIFVAGQTNNRIDEFTAWGEFVRAFGWGVVASGPGNDPRNETQQVSVDATGGSFALRYFSDDSSPQTTAPLAFDSSAASLQSALEALESLDPGDVSVSGLTGGPWSIEFTGRRADADIPEIKVVDSTLTGPGASAVATTQDGASFEVCVPADGDVCRAGQIGSTSPDATTPSVPSRARPGQLARPQSVALDSAGDAYVVDRNFNRVQKFDLSGPTVAFEWMLGGGVNQGPSNPGNLCTAAHIVGGDTCGAGSQGSASGQFGWSLGVSSFIATATATAATATTADDTLYIGDVNRIQKFNTSGAHTGEIAFSGSPLPEPGEVGALAVDNAPSSPNFGDLYFAYRVVQPPFTAEAEQPDVHRLDPATGNELGAPLDVALPGALAVDASGNPYVFDKQVFVSSGDPHNRPSRIMQFDPAGNQTDLYLSGVFDGPFGSTLEALTTSSACGIPGHDLYVSNANASNSFIRAYGPAPTDIEDCPPPPVAPTISNQFATQVGADTATLKARINPHFWLDTTYYLQYGEADCSLGGCAAEPLPPGTNLTSQVTDADLQVSVELEDLDPDTTYHYRFASQSGGGGPVFGPDRTFTTFPAPASPAPCPNDQFRAGTPSELLPDCRAFEMVSPADKNGGDAFQGNTVANLGNVDKIDQATPDGEALTYSAYRAFPGAQGSAWTNQYLARRDPEAGWQTTPLNPPESGPQFLNGNWISRFQGFSEDLCTAFYASATDTPIAPGEVAGFPDLYRRKNCEGSGFEALSTVAPPTLPSGNFQQAFGANLSYYPRVQGYSADGSMAFFRANDRLTANASSATADDGSPIFQLYLRTPTALRLLSVLPSPGGSTIGAAAGVHSTLGTHYGDPSAYEYDNLRHAVSEDGSRVFWTAAGTGPTPSGDDGPGRIYLRLNPDRTQSAVSGGQCADLTRACTIAVSESIDSGDARFEAATPSGSAALFSMQSGVNAGNLYSFDVDKAAAYQPGAATLIAPGVTGVLGASDDLARAYFASRDALAPGASAGAPNLYLYEQGQGLTFIGALSSGTLSAGSEGEGDPRGGFPIMKPTNDLPAFRTSRISADGSVALFASAAALTGYDNRDAVSGASDVEVFRYDAEAGGGAGELRCLSCNPTGARPSGEEVSDRKIWTASTIPGWEYSQHASRALSADGSRAYFNSFDSLDPRDVNGHQDVYQWQAEGTGECDASDPGFHTQNGGCLSLITPGTSSEDSEFVNASADGSDVFIRTRSQLHGTDADTLLDIYDARTAGGFPAPPPQEAGCEGEGCKGASPETPPAAGAGSAVFEGPPDPQVRWQRRKICPKGKRKVVRRGRARCVKRPAKKRSQDKRANHGRGARR